MGRSSHDAALRFDGIRDREPAECFPDRGGIPFTGPADCPPSMLHALALSVFLRLDHGLVLDVLSRVAVVVATHFMLGFQSGLLRNVTA